MSADTRGVPAVRKAPWFTTSRRVGRAKRGLDGGSDRFPKGSAGGRGRGALTAEPDIGLLLPCNVIVYDNGDQTSTVNIVDPFQMLGVVPNPALEPMAIEANTRLRRVLDHLTAYVRT